MLLQKDFYSTRKLSSCRLCMLSFLIICKLCQRGKSNLVNWDANTNGSRELIAKLTKNVWEKSQTSLVGWHSSDRRNAGAIDYAALVPDGEFRLDISIGLPVRWNWLGFALLWISWQLRGLSDRNGVSSCDQAERGSPVSIQVELLNIAMDLLAPLQSMQICSEFTG